jgi:DNA-repair protein complementing XP-A cells
LQELSRLKAKAIREQREAEERRANPPPTFSRSGTSIAGQKRPYASIATSNTPATLRDGRSSTPNTKGGPGRPLDEIQPARNFAKYVEYDFSRMTDTKGGFLTAEDDPHNKALHSGEQDEKPAGMTMKEWERQQLLKSLRNQKAGPFEPGLSVLKKEDLKKCRECGSLEIDWKWEEVFGCAVCSACKEKYPEKYSLLTKTEAKEDYLLTDRKFCLKFNCEGVLKVCIAELKDPELLPHLERPNPHKSTWNNMMLFLRYQIEEYAFSDQKWGSPEALDAEFEKREADKKKRKEDKFKTKLLELKKRTRVEAYKRSKKAGGGGGNFGDNMDDSGKHTHEWGRLVEDPDTGTGVKSCITCGMEVEELIL